MLLKRGISWPGIAVATLGLRHVDSIVSAPNGRVDVTPCGWEFGDADARAGQDGNQVSRALGLFIAVDSVRAGAKLTAGLAVVWRDLMELAAARKDCGGTRISSN